MPGIRRECNIFTADSAGNKLSIHRGTAVTIRAGAPLYEISEQFTNATANYLTSRYNVASAC
jgi:hypothetical protein